MPGIVIACLFYLALVALLLAVAYSKRLFCYYAAAKAAASTGFLLLAVLIWLLRGRQSGAFFWWILPSLALCLAGDVLLGLANTRGSQFSRYFLSGAVAFTLAHCGYCVCFTVTRPGAYAPRPLEWVLPLLMLAGMLLCVRDSRRFAKLHKMRVPGVIYSVFVGLMCAKAVSFAIGTGGSAQGLLVAAGGVLFLISDVVLVFMYFYYKPRRLLRAVNLGTYYLAMLCFALAL